MAFWDKILSHLQSPAMTHLQQFVTDTVSTLQDFENHVTGFITDAKAWFRKGEDEFASIKARLDAIEADMGLAAKPEPKSKS